ncbi:MAG: ECF transporter S component [Lawsonibacter sp.]
MNKTNGQIKNMVVAALMLALAYLLPNFTGNIPQIGSMLLPMHLPVLLCGFLCGGPWGAAVGFVAPLLRSALVGMPPMFPTAVSMAFELAAYGFVSGFLYRRLPKNLGGIYASLIGAMLCGRVVWGVVRALLTLAGNNSFTFSAFLAGAFTAAIPGIVLQLVAIPVVVVALQKAKLVPQNG